MAGDYSRNTFDPRKHYTRVLKQQGRVDVDADWNENNDLVMHRIVEETRDVVGAAGAPKYDAGFGLAKNEDGDDLTISKGRFYVAGILCELEEETTYTTQPHYEPPELPNGHHLAYLDAWEQEISALQDPEIREIALGGPDTARRMKTMWQVRLLPGDVECAQGAAALAAALPKSTGRLAAHTAPLEGDTDPCHLPPTAGYLGMENQLYRVEIQKGGTLPGGGPNDRPTFKWAPDNATLEVAIVNVTGRDLEVSEIGKDDLFRFHDTQWVEIVDQTSVRERKPNPLRRINTVTAGTRIITLQSDPPATSGKGLELRGWKQQAGADENGIRIDSNDFIGLEYGIEVSFADGTYNAGDYWLVPARTAIHEVLWPGAAEGNPEYLAPRGVTHHYAPLARVRVADGAVTSVTDCRKLFPPLTEKGTDFDFYKKHLFGFGVACGLQLVCDGAQKQSVTVKKGYAIDCEGRDMILPSNRKVTLAELPEWQRMADAGAQQVALSMSLGSDGQTIEFHLSAYEREHWLAGSALMKAYQDCQQKLIAYLRDNFKAGDPKSGKVTEPEKRLITAWNLLIQLSNPQTGKKVYISPEEHAILKEVYGELAELLKISSTYCSIGALPEFPEYPLKFPQETWFGKGSHKRVRSAHDEPFAFVFGDDERINFFRAPELRFVHAFPDVGAPRVLDVAQSRDRRRIHVLAEAKGTSFIATCEFEILEGEKAWSSPRPIEADERIVQLATGIEGVELYGLGEQKTIYAIDPATGETTSVVKDADERPFEGFFLVDQESRRCFAAVRNASEPKGRYTRIVEYRVEGAGRRFRFTSLYDLQGSGNEGISFSRRGEEDLICGLITGSDNTKSAVTFRTPQQRSALPLGTTGAVSIAGVSTDLALAAVTRAESNDVRFVAHGKTHDELTMPAQICPSGVAASRRRELFVVNHRSQTVSMTAKPATKFDFPKLANYRADALNAYRDLVVLMLESLKDCFCEHLMPDCPVCGKDDVVYLGVLELDGNRAVRRICPLEKRTWVLSPRNVGYWLSMVPVLPAVRWLVERLCCIDVPKILEDRFEVPPTHDDQWKCANMPAFDEITWDRIKEPYEGAKETLRKKAPALFDFFVPKQKASVVEVQPKMAQFVGAPVDDVVAALGAADIPVRDVAEVTGGRAGLTDLLRPSARFSKDRPVTIVASNGKVVNVIDRGGVREPGGMAGELEDVRRRVDESRRLIEERDAQIRTLSQNVEQLQEQLSAARKTQKESAERIEALSAKAASIDDLKSAVDRISRRLPPTG